MKITKKTTTTYQDENGQQYTLEPVEDIISIEPEKGENGQEFKLKYLTVDTDPLSPDDEDENLFLVHYHRQFWAERKDILSKDDLAAIYQYGDKLITEHNPEKCGCKYQGNNSWSCGHVDGEDEYEEYSIARQLLQDFHIFPVSAYIHSGVRLSLGKTFGSDPGGWDTSHVGAIFASKTEFPEEEQAQKCAEGLLQTWNEYLSGDVYCCVVEKLDENKQSIDYDIVGGFYGLEYAKEALKTEF